MKKLNEMTLGDLDHAAQNNSEKYETRYRNSSRQAFIEGGLWALEKMAVEEKIKGMGALHDEFEKLTERLEVNEDQSAMLMFCSDYENTGVSFSGLVKNLVVLLIAVMHDDKDLAAVILKASELFLKFENVDEQEVKS